MAAPFGLRDKLRELALFSPTTMPVLSVYLNTQPDQHGRDNFSPFLRKELKARAATYPPETPERRSFERDAERIRSWVDTELRRSSNGAAIFACSGAGDFFEALQFDAPFHENQLYVYHQPHLYTLAKLYDKHRSYAAVIADTNSARIFVFGLGRTLGVESITNVKVRSRTWLEGWWLRRAQFKVENYHLRHAKQVVDELDRIVREEDLDHVILAGDPVIMPLLLEQFPRALAAKVVDQTKLDITAPEQEVFRDTLETIRAEDARTDAESVRATLDEYRAGGLAAIGVHDVLAALSNGQVHTLFISAAIEEIHPEAESLNPAIAPSLAGLPQTPE
ncbi:MAG TPA: Vms1/Ankzf1 family peptidyl-tRNA hydrolase [Bryobacteraceae bacterium]|nr:Vms1/Ankzf1 family peptidyl-tRNA hydrolase [Bryobacteraceae bacterium]